MTVSLGALSDRTYNSGQVISTITVPPDSNPHDLLLKAAMSYLPGKPGHSSPFQVTGTANISQLVQSNGTFNAGGGPAGLYIFMLNV